MQPEPSAVFDRTQPDPSSNESHSNTQHGHDLYVDSPGSGLLRETGGPETVHASPQGGDQSPLNPVIPGLSTPPGDRVSQYENAMGQSSKKQGDFEFQMVPSSAHSDLSLDIFPNEVLTHILSHLPPPSLSSIALVSRRFHSLVTTPHAWRIAFSRFFPGPYTTENGTRLIGYDHPDNLASDKRFFSRLTALASWRSEYILRTRLIRSLSRGKPASFEPSKKNGTVRAANVRNGSAVATYTSQLLYPVSHLHGAYGTEVAKKEPHFIHGASEQGIASASDPSSVKVGTWGLSDHQLFRHFADLYPGDAEYGLGAGNMVGLPNQMDVSQPYGMIYGEGCPQGRSYFISTTELRGRFLDLTETSSQPPLGIPALNMITTGVTAVWIAKSSHVLKVTGGLVGMLSGTSSGVLSAFSLGPHPTYEKRFERGQVTAKWVLCPGVPIIAIAVDDNYSPRRHARRRIWATVLNALGEVFFLSDLPQQPEVGSAKMSPEEMNMLAWKTGRSVNWELVELSRRTARPDPYSREPVDGSYSPRSSCDAMKLSQDQIAAETKEIEQFLSFKPKHFRKVCEGWDMRRDLLVDFAGDDTHGAGESIAVIARGIGEQEKASIRRYMRKASTSALPSHHSSNHVAVGIAPSTLFGGSTTPSISEKSESLPPSRASGRLNDPVFCASNTEWRISDFVFGDRKSVQITASALDLSTYASVTAEEDPLLGMSGSSADSSTVSSPLPHMKQPSSHLEIPGQRGRYMAVGTNSGLVMVWDIRSPTAKNSEVINSINPVRIIQTESPQVSCVAMSSLYLVHGGNDGLVQAWDPLASSARPIRTINSRFSSRARRRLIQAEATLHGVGNNFYATGAISLDPDPTVLRGMVALGTHLRYWSYSSSTADQYKTSKRRLRRGPKGMNSTAEGQRFNNSGRGAIYDHIEDEKVEMKRQEVADRKEKAHLSNRFGVDLLGPDVDEDQVIAYARLLSEEAFASEALKRGNMGASSIVSSPSSSDTVGRRDSSFAPDELSSSSSPYEDPVGDDLAPDIAEAIRLSLLDEAPKSFESDPFISNSSSDWQGHHDDYSSPSPESGVGESSREQELTDLEFAIQLSLAETQPQEQEEFPSLPMSSSPDKSKGKGKGRAL
ncbi:F-box and WD domain protein [Aspergillus steynii IBT 23096]|uniref:F-box and WD domain protein n=1 Tax=Aspergillus steynii IBT 23096 TaxID=1392250 RepID=A0A2I2FUU0_9EURO|nr:F-box and WD domain protein [Aspergillus steynii IBT 23096]PLB44409.1 F-box and WD domain protein [Aspergillus steynii IBT 23096]